MIGLINAYVPAPIMDPEAERAYLERRNINETYERIFEDSLEHSNEAEEYLKVRGVPMEISHGKVGISAL